MSSFQISANFRSSEFSVSSSYPQLVVDVPDELTPNMIELVVLVLQRMRNRWGKNVTILSGYRSEQLNTSVGGAAGSQHMVAQAADISVEGMTPKEVFNSIKTHYRDYVIGQVICYPTFVHVSSPSKKYPKATFFSVIGGKLRLS